MTSLSHGTLSNQPQIFESYYDVMHRDKVVSCKLAEQTPQTPEGFPSPLPQPLPYAIGLPRGEGSKQINK